MKRHEHDKNASAMYAGTSTNSPPTNWRIGLTLMGNKHCK